MPSFQKLVRDRIPEIIIANSEKPITRILNDKEFLQELIKKLKEETLEFEEDNSIEELADIQEVILALAEAIGEDSKKLEEVRANKAQERGSFKNKVYLEGIK